MKKPAPEFGVPFGHFSKLKRPIYDLSEPGDLWYRALERHHRDDLKMTPLRSDPSLYFHVSHGKISGLSGTYVDEIL